MEQEHRRHDDDCSQRRASSFATSPSREVIAEEISSATGLPPYERGGVSDPAEEPGSTIHPGECPDGSVPIPSGRPSGRPRGVPKIQGRHERVGAHEASPTGGATSWIWPDVKAGPPPPRRPRRLFRPRDASGGGRGRGDSAGGARA